MIRLNKHDSYKIGLEEIMGLKKAMNEVLKPVLKILQKKIYWKTIETEEVEYKSRHGFAPYAHNCGGLRIQEIISNREEHHFAYLQFGEHDGDCLMIKEDEECSCGEADDLLAAKLELWLKFEGIKDNKMFFYIVLHGGNNDAPYFRKSETIFECEFSARNLTEFKKKAKTQLKKIERIIK